MVYNTLSSLDVLIHQGWSAQALQCRGYEVDNKGQLYPVNVGQKSIYRQQ